MSDKPTDALSIEILGVTISYSFSIVTFVLGFIISRYTMTKNESLQHKLRLQEQSNKLSETLNLKYNDFIVALGKYINNESASSLDDFNEISLKGEAYFTQLKIISDTINSGNLDVSSVRNTHAPIIKDAIEKVIPTYYETLQKIATKSCLSYSGEFKRENYKSVFEVYEKYCI